MTSEGEVAEPAIETDNPNENAAGNRESTWIDPQDGTVYEWDILQRGWFPQINDDLIATYTMSYASSDTVAGAQDNVTSAEVAGGREEREGERVGVKEKGGDLEIEPPVKKKKNETPSWFEVEDNQNKHVYVTNLPSTTTEQQFVELMSKCGVIAQHEDGRAKVKLYRTEEGEPKGDGLCTYLRVESVAYSQLILDGSEFEGHVLKVEPAVFEMKGLYNAALKPKKKRKKKKNRAEKLVKWKEPYYDRPRHERVVIIKNVFTPAELSQDPLLSAQVRDQIRSECEKHGKVKKAIVCEKHSDGIVSVMFLEHPAAEECVRVMQGREFAGRVIEACLWDGETKYVLDESEEDREKRLEVWKEYLKD